MKSTRRRDSRSLIQTDRSISRQYLCQNRSIHLYQDINHGIEGWALPVLSSYQGHHFSCYWYGRTGEQESGVESPAIVLPAWLEKPLFKVQPYPQRKDQAVLLLEHSD
jgi:hypothetical protein